MKTLKVTFRYRRLGSPLTRIMEELIDVETDSTDSEIDVQIKEHKNKLIRETPNVIFQDGFTYANADFIIDDRAMKYAALKNFILNSPDTITVRNIAIELLDNDTYEDTYDNHREKINKL